MEDIISDRYVWIGAVTESSFKINVDVHDNESNLVLAKESTFDNIVKILDKSESDNTSIDVSIFGNLRAYQIQDLDPGTKYFIGIQSNNQTYRIGSITTFSPSNRSNEIVFAFGSCQRGYDRSECLAEIARWGEVLEQKKPGVPFFFIHMGDLHYSDIATNNVSLFEDAHRKTVTQHNAAKLFRTTPIVYIWDDHDYGKNNADSRSQSKPAALSAFKNMIPSYESNHDSIYHAFTVANVRFIMTDVRSESDPSCQCMLSESQLEFFYQELRQWNDYDVVVWMTTRPWIDKPKQGADTWGGYQKQRNEIANFIAELKIDNLIQIAGDAHMLAVDDGTNSCYADEKYHAKGFPVFQAAPLAGLGSIKGGPYSHGVRTRWFWMNRQYGLLSIRPKSTATGSASEIKFSGFRIKDRDYAQSPQELWEKKPIIEYETTLPREDD